jgi:hypothetical protein
LNYLARGQIEQAYLAGDELCRLSPSSPGCFLVRGWVAAELGDYGTALHDLQAVVFAAPGTSRAAAASWRLAEYNRNLGQEQQAWLWMQRATPPPPGFDTGEKYGCLPVIVPLDWWPAVRPLPVGGLAWQTALKWAEEDGLQEVANQLCEVGLEYDAAFDLCR